MPGFNIAGQGDGPSSTAEIRRTHRWLFESTNHVAQNVLLVLKTASRPSVEFDDPDMHHNQEEVFFAGKHHWTPISMTYYDVEQDPDVSKAMWDWLGKCLILVGSQAANVYPPAAYKATVSNLQMRDGMGDATETWAIYNGWPKQINWNDLDYTSSDLQEIEVEFRFDRAVRL